MKVRFCSCGNQIPAERLEVFPSTSYCVSCSDSHTKKKVGFLEYSCKTNPVLVFVDPTDTEGLRRAERAMNRSR